MPRTMLSLTLTLAAAALLGGCKTCPTCVSCEAHPPTVVFNFTRGQTDLHATTMALQLAGHALDDERRVVLFFNVKAVTVPTTLFDKTRAYHDKPVAALLAKLIGRGATVLVCPHCMQAEGVEPDDLIAGAAVADREKLFTHLHANSVVFTY